MISTYTTFIKFFRSRILDSSQEIRNNHITREEAQALVNKFDGEFPDNYFNEILEYLDITPEEFSKVEDEFRSPHLWRMDGNQWILQHSVNGPKKITKP